MSEHLDAILKAAKEMEAATERLSSVPLELKARGLVKGEPVPAAVFEDTLDRLAGSTRTLVQVVRTHQEHQTSGFRAVLRAIEALDSRLKVIEHRLR